VPPRALYRRKIWSIRWRSDAAVHHNIVNKVRPSSMSLPAFFSCAGCQFAGESSSSCAVLCTPSFTGGVRTTYPTSCMRPVDLSRSRAGLRSSSTTNFAMPQLRTKCGQRTFSHAGPAAWHALPEDMRAVSDSVLFRKRLKTHLFMVALCNRADHYIFAL